jgi:hypothetical protein
MSENIEIMDNITIFDEYYKVKTNLTMKQLKIFGTLWDDNGVCKDDMSFLELVLRDEKNNELKYSDLEKLTPSAKDLDSIFNLQEEFKKKYKTILRKYQNPNSYIMDYLAKSLESIEV